MITDFLHGFLLALALILPIGPQNTFVIARGAGARRFRETLPVALTAALSDTLLIAAAVGGVSLLLLGLPSLHTLLTAVGILYVLYIGAQFWRTARSGAEVAAPEAADARKDVLRALSVSLLNPHAILDTLGIIGAASAQVAGASGRFMFALGAVLVSWLWFFALAAFGRALGLGDRSGRARFYLQRVSALLMWAIGLRMAWVLLGL